MPQYGGYSIHKHFVIVGVPRVFEHPSSFRAGKAVAHAVRRLVLRAGAMPAAGLFACRHRAGYQGVARPAMWEVSITDAQVQPITVVAVDLNVLDRA